ncbi:hypothetical protein TNCV_1418661 [Trichonephila clavipes]|nr:hypothetical protein TNCV_1418661 [Trichonephila clavipes]
MHTPVYTSGMHSRYTMPWISKNTSRIVFTLEQSKRNFCLRGDCGCIFNDKLKWTKHVEHVISKARKRLFFLKRLAGVRF